MLPHKAGPHRRSGRYTHFPYRMYVLRRLSGMKPNQSCSSGDALVIIKDQYNYRKNTERAVALLNKEGIECTVEDFITQIKNRTNSYGLSSHARERVFLFPHDKYNMGGSYE